MNGNSLPETILWEDLGPDGVKLLTINRPERMNAIGPVESRGLFEAIGRFRDDDDATVLVITGAGSEAFCAGADLHSVAAMYQDEPAVEPLFDLAGGGDPRIPAEGNIGPTRWSDIHKPVIAAVNGAAYAGGLEWACFAHMRVADQHASFGVTCRRWNVGLGDGGTQRLPRLVGMAAALDLIITGRVIGTEEAARIGLLNRIAPSGQCVEEAVQLAHQIAALPQPALRTDLEATIRGFGEPLDRGLEIEAERFNTLMGDPQLRQGAERFVNRDHPDRKAGAEPLHRPAAAYEFARVAHRDTPGKFGSAAPFINHPANVARLVAGYGGDDVAVCAAYLHDTLEKSPTGADDIERNFGPAIRNLVDVLSNDPAIKDPQEQRLDRRQRALADGTRARLILAADRLDGFRQMITLLESGSDPGDLNLDQRIPDWQDDLRVLAGYDLPQGLKTDLDQSMFTLTGLIS
ncbi:MAG: enoyl-CoA hydratase-related protein [Solirubrobacterales bacterium]